MAKDKKNERKSMNLDETIENLSLSGIKILKLGDKKFEHIEVIPSGSITLDMALGIGGYPRGRTIEIFGDEMSGKTTLTLIAIAQAQKAGGNACFIDAEHAISIDWAKKLGVNIKDLYFLQPDSGEDALKAVEQLARSNKFDIIVVDSVAALAPKAELDGEMEDAHYALLARLMSKAMNRLTSIVSKSKTAVIFINQNRDKIGQAWGDKKSQPGGKALKFYASVRLSVNIVMNSSIKDKNGVKIGHSVHIKVAKNKCAPPFREGEFVLNFLEGIDNNVEIFESALTKEIIKLKGKIYSFEKWNGNREEFKQLITNDKELKEKLIVKLKRTFEIGGIDDGQIEDDTIDTNADDESVKPGKKVKFKLKKDEEDFL